MPIKLTQILSPTPATNFKVHFARFNQHCHPLEAYARGMDEWRAWQEYRPAKDDFNRPFIFSLMQVYYEVDSWLFGGVWEVVSRHTDKYEVRLADLGKDMIGRLKLKSPYRDRQTRTRLENHIDTFEVIEIFPEAYAGRRFPGYSDIELGFDELETITRNMRPDWKAALENIYGIYVITDESTGKRYVGSASGGQGIWSRWCAYVETGHGGNVELRELVCKPSLDYCRKNFRFALLEHLLPRESNERVLQRESFWKKLLLSRTEFGMNRN